MNSRDANTLYRVVQINGELFWLDDTNKPQSFIVLTGEQLVWQPEE